MIKLKTVLEKRYKHYESIYIKNKLIKPRNKKYRLFFKKLLFWHKIY